MNQVTGISRSVHMSSRWSFLFMAAGWVALVFVMYPSAL